MKVQIGMGGIGLETVAEVCGGRLIGTGTVAAVCTDSREATDAQTQFAVMVGERVDAHDYMRRAYDGGCRLFLCQRIPSDMEGCDFGAVVVPDTVEALGKLAEYYTDSMKRPVVGITGSVGKTTTKEFISAVVSQRYAVHKTKANHNSTVGLPMSMLEATDKENLSVVEMGMSGLGEIAFMSRVAKPSVACITNIGSSHLELLGTRENICRAKLEIASGMPEDGVLLLNGDEPLLRAMKPDGVSVKFVSLEKQDADFAVSNIRYDKNGSRFDILAEGELYRDVQLSSIGRPFVWAAAFAVAVGKQLGIEEQSIRAGLLKFENASMRQSITESRGITFIEDCYNASPESVRAAIDVMETLAGETGARMVALLGDMKELGTDEVEMHRSVGLYFAQKGGKKIFTVGELAQNMAKGAVEGGVPQTDTFSRLTYASEEDVATVGDLVASELRQGDILLVKASRSVGAERFLAYVKQKI